MLKRDEFGDQLLELREPEYEKAVLRLILVSKDSGHNNPALDTILPVEAEVPGGGIDKECLLEVMSWYCL